MNSVHEVLDDVKECFLFASRTGRSNTMYAQSHCELKPVATRIHVPSINCITWG
jgi:hypothetical protein